MSLRGRITLIVTACFLTLALVLLVEGRSREAAVESRLENAQVLMLRVSWAGLAGAERQRLLGHLESFRRSPGSTSSVATGNLGGLQRATVAIRSDLRTAHFQAILPDGTTIYDTRGDEARPAILSPAQVNAVAARSEPLDGLVATPEGDFTYILAAPVFATSGVVGVAVVWGDITRMLAELSAAIGMPSVLLGPDGRLRAEAGDPDGRMMAAIETAPPANDRVAFLRQDDRTLRVAAASFGSLFGGAQPQLVALSDVTEEVGRREALRAISYVALASAMILSFSFINWSLRNSFRPLNAVIHSLDGLSEGRTDLQVNVPDRRDEIGRLAGTFETFRKGMEARVRLDRLAQELEVASRIQSQCLPKTFPSEPGIDFAASMEPMREVGGDFYDAFRLPDGRIGCVMADVADKGVGAALFMAIARTVVRSTAMSAPDPAECVNRVNAYLCEDNEAILFVTLVYAILDPETGRIAMCNAGHNPPAVIEPGGAVSFVGSQPQPALGVWEEFVYEGSEVTLQPGSRLFLYTDGVTEAMTAEGAEFGEERLKESLSDVSDAGADELVRHVFASVESFVDGAARSDDITCMAVVYHAA